MEITGGLISREGIGGGVSFTKEFSEQDSETGEVGSVETLEFVGERFCGLGSFDSVLREGNKKAIDSSKVFRFERKALKGAIASLPINLLELAGLEGTELGPFSLVDASCLFGGKVFRGAEGDLVTLLRSSSIEKRERKAFAGEVMDLKRDVESIFFGAFGDVGVVSICFFFQKTRKRKKKTGISLRF